MLVNHSEYQHFAGDFSVDRRLQIQISCGKYFFLSRTNKTQIKLGLIMRTVFS